MCDAVEVDPRTESVLATVSVTVTLGVGGSVFETVAANDTDGVGGKDCVADTLSNGVVVEVRPESVDVGVES